ncbi:endonuclease III [bacterium]|nr:endonuclease III [bacterium]
MAAKPKKPNYADYHTQSSLWDKVDEGLKDRIGKLRKNAKKSAEALKMAEVLRGEFPEAGCALHYKTPLQLLVATILSAQCTDERVNMVTPALFKKYPTALDFASAPPGELEKDIHSTGFFNNKAKAIRAACADIHERFADQVPEDMDELLSLRGVARKTANVVRCNAFDYPGLTVDTHFKRITNRLGLTKQSDPEKIEAEIANLLPPDEWSHFCHSVILHGRKTCKARKPDCASCALQTLCPSAFKSEI